VHLETHPRQKRTVSSKSWFACSSVGGASHPSASGCSTKVVVSPSLSTKRAAAPRSVACSETWLESARVSPAPSNTAPFFWMVTRGRVRA